MRHDLASYRAARSGADTGERDAAIHPVGADPGAGHWLVQLGVDDLRWMRDAHLLAALRAGAIAQGTFVWRRGMSQWLAAGTVPELAAVLGPLPATQPPRQRPLPASPRDQRPLPATRPPRSQRPLPATQPPRSQRMLPATQPPRRAAPVEGVRVGPLGAAAPVRAVSPTFDVVLAPSVIAVVMILLVSSVLALGGVFETRGSTPDAASRQP